MKLRFNEDNCLRFFKTYDMWRGLIEKAGLSSRAAKMSPLRFLENELLNNKVREINVFHNTLMKDAVYFHRDLIF